MYEGAPFLQNLAERLEYVDLGHPQEVLNALAVSMAELVRGLESTGVFASVTEYVTYDHVHNIAKGCLKVEPGGWGASHESLCFFILRQGFTYNVEQKAYEYKMEL